MFAHTHAETLVDVIIPYIDLGVTEGVVTQSVPNYDDGTLSPIYVSFPLGSQLQSTVYVCNVVIMIT